MKRGKIFHRKKVFTILALILLTCGYASITTIHPASPREAMASSAPEGIPGSFSHLAKKANPSVVNISAVKVIKSRGPAPLPFGPNDPFRDFFDRFFRDQVPKNFRQQGLGTGLSSIKRDIYLPTIMSLKWRKRLRLLFRIKGSSRLKLLAVIPKRTSP